jgi:Ca2+-binding EF-hand superfamily protein
MKNIIPAVFVSTFFALSPAYAGSCGGGDHAHNLEEMASKYFNRMDANGDEIITKAEFEASTMKNMVKSFDSLQPNESGVVTKSDFIETFVKMHPVTKNEA